MIRILLSLLLIAIPAPVWAAWQRAETAHFIIYADAGRDWLGDYAVELERFDMLARSLFALQRQDTGMKLTIFVLDTPAAVRAAGGKAGGISGFYVAGAGGAVAVVPKMAGPGQSSEIILRHEYAHHLMMQYFPAAYPLWYVEGFADFLSTASFDREGFASLGLPPPMRWVTAARGPEFGLDRMLGADQDSLDPAHYGSFYADAWLLTHYLTVNAERKGQLERYLDLINAGRPQVEAAVAAFGPLDRLRTDFGRYRGRQRLSYYRLPQPFVYAGTVAVATLDAAGQETMAERIALAQGVVADRRLALAVALDKAAKRHPDSAETFAMLAEARFRMGDFDGAEAAADRALALDPQRARAALWRGLAGAGRLRKAGDRDPTAWKAARSFIVRANRAAPDDALPLYENYRTYRWMGLAPNPLAESGLARAYQLLPQHVGIRFAYARMLADAGKREAAIALLAPLANAPHRLGNAETAAHMVAAIRAGKPVGEPVPDESDEAPHD